MTVRKKKLEDWEAKLRAEEDEFRSHKALFEQRMRELAELGAKVQQQSAEVRDTCTACS